MKRPRRLRSRLERQVMTALRELSRDSDSLLFLHGSLRGTRHSVFISLLFARCVDLFDATRELFLRGWHSPARIILRAYLDALFVLRAVCRNRAMRRAYEAAHQIHRKRIGGKLRQLDPSLAASLSLSISEKDLAKVERAVTRRRARHVTTEQFAEAADLKAWYLLPYTALSGTVHAHVHDIIVDHVGRDRSGTVLGIRVGRDIRRSYVDHLAHLGYVHSLAFAAAATILHKDDLIKFLHYDATFAKIMKQTLERRRRQRDAREKV